MKPKTPADSGDSFLTRIFRSAHSDDARGIAEVHVRSWQAAYRGQVPDSYLDGLSVAKRELHWAQVLRDRKRGVLVAEQERIVGFASFGPFRDEEESRFLTGEIYAIYVLEDFWNCGIGRTLMENALIALKEDGFGSVKVWVLETNKRARTFYEKLGFSTDGLKKTEKRGDFELHEIRYGMIL